MSALSTMVALVVRAEPPEELRVPVVLQQGGHAVNELHIWQTMHVRVKRVPDQSMHQERRHDGDDDDGPGPAEHRENRVGRQQDGSRHRDGRPPREGGAAVGVGVERRVRALIQRHVVQRLAVVLHVAVSPVGAHLQLLPDIPRQVQLVDAEVLEVSVVDVLVERHDGIQCRQAKHCLAQFDAQRCSRLLHAHGKSPAQRRRTVTAAIALGTRQMGGTSRGGPPSSAGGACESQPL
mmetsp:Transcript_47318/g.122259  ORF Transcript_47318/g.122259 Transcript_47318/m.122259 type:complete len:236 (+) Transcript_47318:712-1419(+)